MKVHVEVKTVQDNYVSLYEMPTESLGITDDGDVFLRTHYGATCLTNVGKTINPLSREPKHTKVRLLKAGESVTLTVKE